MADKKENFNIKEYINIFLRRKWFFIVPMAVIYFSFLASSFFLPKIYEAKAVILIHEKKTVNPLLKGLAVSTAVADRMGALREEILSWPRLFRLIEKLGLNKDIEDAFELEVFIAKLREDIVLRMRRNNIIEISYRGKTPRKTQEVVTALCDILIERNISSRLEDTSSAIEFINDQLTVYKEKLNKSETSLREFKEVYGLGALPGLEESSITGTALVRLNEELGAAEAEFVMASIDCTDEHPRVQALKQKIEALKERREMYVENMAQQAGVDPQAYVRIADSLPRQEEELIRLTRDKSINEEIYAMLLQRLESAKITENLDNSDNRTKFRIIEPARFPLKPANSNKIKFNLMGIALGGMAGFGFIYLLESTDSSFKSADELKNFFDCPVLGSVSKIVTEDDLAKKRKSTFKITFTIGLTAIVLLLIIIAAVIIKEYNLF